MLIDEKNMFNKNTLISLLMSMTAEPVFVTDATSAILHISDSFADATGCAASDLQGLHVDQVAERLGLSGIASNIKEAFFSGEKRICSFVLSGDGKSWQLTTEPIFEQGLKVGCVSILHTELLVVQEKSDGIDKLTCLPNRHLYFDRVEQTLLNAQRGSKSVAIILAGVDLFSEINDVLGERAGDLMLKEIAVRLHDCVRTSDTLARLDGDIFAFVMQISAIDDCVLLTEKILHTFEQPFSPEQHKDVALSCSVGVSIYPADGARPDELIKNAVSALNYAKQNGRNRCQFFSSQMNDRARNLLEIERNIRRALINREFVVYYQPKVDVNTQQVAGLESLVRWRDPERGLIPPSEFIPIAEQSGLIEQIGQWVLEETCEQSCRWQKEGLPPVRASVNVSARQFNNRNFVSSVENILKKTGLDPAWLELEITESMLMGDIEAIALRMEDLRKIGVSLSIDDFGTGYSSLSYLSRFPITTLKIDRAFIADVQSNPQTAEIARAIIGLSHGLNLEVVAEGAEVFEQIEFLKSNGCMLVQGFFYSQALPADDFAALLRCGTCL